MKGYLMDPIEDDITKSMEIHIRPDLVLIGFGDELIHVPFCSTEAALPETIDVYVEKGDGTVEENATFIDEEEYKADMRHMREEEEQKRPKLTTTTSINVRDFEVSAGEWMEDGGVQFVIRFGDHQTAQIQRMAPYRRS
jgi:hypothetical protein